MDPRYEEHKYLLGCFNTQYFIHHMIFFRYISTYDGTQIQQSSDGLFEYCSSCQYMHSSLGWVCSSSKEIITMFTSMPYGIATKVGNAVVESILYVNNWVHSRISYLFNILRYSICNLQLPVVMLWISRRRGKHHVRNSWEANQVKLDVLDMLFSRNEL